MNRSIKNIVFGVLGQVITIVIGIVLPRMFIISYGSEVNGMLSSVNNIFTYIALLEAGIGTATVQALYGPLARKEEDSISEIISATNIFYRRVGFLYLIAIAIFAVVYPLAVKSEIPKITVVLVILFIGLGNVINFFFQGKMKQLMIADGRQYVITNITTVVHMMVSVSKIILISLGMSVVAITIAQFVLNILQMIIYSILFKKYYPWINLKAKPNKKAISQSKNVIVHQVSGLVFNNTDTIILSIFCGFQSASIYAIYNMLFEMISTLINNINNGFVYKMGQLYNSEHEKFCKYYEVWETYMMALGFALYCITYIFILPFISLYTVGADIEYIDKWIPILFVIIKVLVSGRCTSGYTASFAGHFKQTQWRSVVEMIINLSVTLVCVNILGIYGVLLGTIAALLYRTNDMIIYNCKHLIKRSCLVTYKKWIVYIALFALVVFANQYINIDLSSYIKIIFACIPYTIVICLLFFIAGSLCDINSFKLGTNLVKTVVSNKISRKRIKK